eukprot:TRINITY_DN10827_c0_g1_i1.p1 TRINITY_DN10827_c0_g1~~TRINITY_DN10827_c0_g1_i1.p1  ORF type:complete len:279 (-),score=61.61 TRINITY_DN10827_c0_g1_i1:46-882(-)
MPLYTKKNVDDRIYLYINCIKVGGKMLSSTMLRSNALMKDVSSSLRKKGALKKGKHVVSKRKLYVDMSNMLKLKGQSLMPLYTRKNVDDMIDLYMNCIKEVEDVVVRTPYQHASIEDLINVGQPYIKKRMVMVKNIDYALSILAENKGEPTPLVKALLGANFKSYEDFVDLFKDYANNLPSNGNLWVDEKSSSLRLKATDLNYTFDEGSTFQPLLALNLQEFNYIENFGQDKEAVIDAWLNTVNWPLIEKQWKIRNNVHSNSQPKDFIIEPPTGPAQI